MGMWNMHIADMEPKEVRPKKIVGKLELLVIADIRYTNLISENFKKYDDNINITHVTNAIDALHIIKNSDGTEYSKSLKDKHYDGAIVCSHIPSFEDLLVPDLKKDNESTYGCVTGGSFSGSDYNFIRYGQQTVRESEDMNPYGVLLGTLLDEQNIPFVIHTHDENQGMAKFDVTTQLAQLNGWTVIGTEGQFNDGNFDFNINQYLRHIYDTLLTKIQE